MCAQRWPASDSSVAPFLGTLSARGSWPGGPKTRLVCQAGSSPPSATPTRDRDPRRDAAQRQSLLAGDLWESRRPRFLVLNVRVKHILRGAAGLALSASREPVPGRCGRGPSLPAALACSGVWGARMEPVTRGNRRCLCSEVRNGRAGGSWPTLSGHTSVQTGTSVGTSASARSWETRHVEAAGVPAAFGASHLVVSLWGSFRDSDDAMVHSELPSQPDLSGNGTVPGGDTENPAQPEIPGEKGQA